MNLQRYFWKENDWHWLTLIISDLRAAYKFDKLENLNEDAQCIGWITEMLQRMNPTNLDLPSTCSTHRKIRNEIRC